VNTDASLGFAGGVMTAASFWSLLAPGIERAQTQMDGSVFACVPIAFGFIAGALFVWAADFVLPFLGFSSDDMVAAFISNQVCLHGPSAHART
jgi:zinc transporter 11